MSVSAIRCFVAAMCILLLGACAQSKEEATQVSRAAGVPASAQPVTGDLELGHIEHALGPSPDVSQARTLEGLSCSDDLLIARTDVETLYAQMPCDRFLPADAVDRLTGKPAAIRLDASGGLRLFIESTAGTAEFTVLGVWVEER